MLGEMGLGRGELTSSLRAVGAHTPRSLATGTGSQSPLR